MSKIKQKFYDVEELRHGDWNKLYTKDKDGNKEDKFVVITEETAEVMNRQSGNTKVRYVLSKNQEPRTKKEAKTSKKQVKTVENDKSDNTDDEKDKLVEEYEVVLGKKPHHMLGVDKLKAQIEEAKAERAKELKENEEQSSKE